MKKMFGDVPSVPAALCSKSIAELAEIPLGISNSS
uniref:Uncharacterized protein n=1 Tax=Arundo donax TaxID=35708 RepID=A0A0A8ZW62_ARUDO